MIHQRHGGTAGTRAAGAADAVDVIFRHVGQFEVHHLRKLVDVEAARGDVGGHQHRDAAVLELRQRLGAGRLALVAMDGGGRNAVLDQFFGQAVGAVLGAGEYQHLFPGVMFDQVAHQVALVALLHQVHGLFHQFRRGVAASDGDEARIVQQAFRQFLDLVGEGGGEQQVLALFRQHYEYFLDVADEAHVQHAVGFVQHQDFDAGQVQCALSEVVEQAAGGGDQDVQGLLQAGVLRADADAAEHHHGSVIEVFAVGLDRFLDLRCEFARRHQNQAARAAGLGCHRLFAQQMQDRQGEAGGLAGAGLCAGQQVAALEHQRDGLRLHRGWGGITGVCDGLQQWLRQTEVGEMDFLSQGVTPATACYSS
ncbi:hypothetical protein GALL_409680 [mine drainage metagenome]|uniref:Uncharacterized protein n=1 Tax=mine drainage metagenome TaxID=410659 RepID=A0A1J5Q108_9ZZZZ